MSSRGKKIKANWKNKALRGIMVGYADNRPSDTYRIYLYETNQVVETRDVVWGNWMPLRVRDRMPGTFNPLDPDVEETDSDNGIDEDQWIEISWEDDSTSITQPKTQIMKIQAQTQSNLKPVPAKPRASLIPSATSVSSMRDSIQTSVVDNTSSLDKPLAQITSKDPVTARPITRSMIAQTPEQKRSLRTRSQTQTKHLGYHIKVETFHYVYDVTIISDPNEPKTIQQALKSSEHKEWMESAIAELVNFYSRGSWSSVPRQVAYDKGKNIIGSKWVFKKKKEPDGSIRYKSRVVSKGYMQIPGVDTLRDIHLLPMTPLPDL